MNCPQMPKSMKKYTGYILAFVLFVVCSIMFMRNSDDFGFLDNRETYFVSIAKAMLNRNDWINTAFIPGKIPEFPPLFFIIANSVCFLFGKITTWTMRISSAVFAVFSIIVFFRLIRKSLTNTYSFIIALVAATSLGMIVFSHIASYDVISAMLMMIPIILSESIILRKKFDSFILHLSGWFLIGLATVCCGIFGTIVPVLSIFGMYAFSGCIKKFFVPRIFLPGVLLYIATVLPWYLFMFRKLGFAFVKKFLYFDSCMQGFNIPSAVAVLLIFCIGFLPWSFSFIWSLGSKYKDILSAVFSYFKDNSEAGLKEKWRKLNKINKFVSLNIIFFFNAFIFALFFGFQNYFLILLMIFPASCIAGYYWYQYMVRREHNGSIFFATVIPNLILIICAITGLFGHNVINKYVIQGLNNLIIPLILIFMVIPVVSILAAVLRGRRIPWISNVLLMFCLSFIITPDVFNLYLLNSGENDLISFAGIAKEKNDKLTAYIPQKKYSISYYYDKEVYFLPYGDIKLLSSYLDSNPDNYVIVEIKEMKKIEDNNINYYLTDSGKKYCVIKKNLTENVIMPEEEPKVYEY